jgi:cytochrome b6-f complex iron-sulfur subunit
MATRRDVLKGVCGLAVLALAPVVLAEDAEAAPGIHHRKDGRVAVHVKAVPALSRVGGAVAIGTVKGIPTAVVRTGSSTYEALDLRCTHAGVTVQESGSSWACPAHGSRFGITGNVSQGPAQRSLATVRSSFNGKKVLVG